MRIEKARTPIKRRIKTLRTPPKAFLRDPDPSTLDFAIVAMERDGEMEREGEGRRGEETRRRLVYF